MGIYRDLGRKPGVFRVIASQLTARFPFGMLSIVMLLHVQQGYGDYTTAGTVLAAESVGQAVAGPLTSRLMGRLGIRKVLASTSLIAAALLLVIAYAYPPAPLLISCALAMGLATPPVTPAVRTLYPGLVPGNQLSALFSLDAAAQEIIWVLGPVVAVFTTSQFGTSVGLTVAAAFMIAGGAWFISTPAIGRVRIPKSRHGIGAVLRYPTVIISTVLGFFFVASFSAIEAGIVALYSTDGGHGGTSMESGVVLAVFAGGSLVGGLIMGHRELGRWSPFLRMVVVATGTTLALVSTNMWWMSAVLFVAGLGTAPTFAAFSSIVSATVRFSETAEAYGWIGTGQLVGVATGSALAGVAIDAAGAHGAILVSVLLIGIAALGGAACVHWIPDLRGRAIEPPPETSSVPIPLP